jgi:spore maturation protein CgeB
MSGGLYFTQYHRELGDVYEVGREIVCYHSTEDLAEKIKFYFSHPDKAEEVRLSGQRRAINEHTWARRCRQAFLALGVSVPGSIPGISLLKTRKPRRVLLRAAVANGQ